MRENRLRNQKGFTLIELLVSIVILSLLATCFITLLSGANSNVFSSGNKGKALFKAQETLEFEMAKGVSKAETTLVIQFDGSVGVKPVTVEGAIRQESVVYDDKTVTITSFIVKK